jgi:CRP-like cAMP-binding protein
LQRLAREGWLARTSEEFRAALLPLARWRHFEAGAPVTLAGEEADDLIGLAAGTVAFTAVMAGRDVPVSHVAPAVFWMGYGPLLRGISRIVTAEARSMVWVASFPKARVAPLIEGRPGGWRPFMELMAIYGDTNAMIVSDLLIRDSCVRSAAVLLRFAGLRNVDGRVGAAGPVMVPVTQTEFAAATCLSRNAAGKILREFAEAGLVETVYGGIVVRDGAGLFRKMDGGDGP